MQDKFYRVSHVIAFTFLWAITTGFIGEERKIKARSFGFLMNLNLGVAGQLWLALYLRQFILVELFWGM